MAEHQSPEQLVEALRRDQCARWEAGEHIPAERYLSDHPALLDDSENALKLVYQEVLLREEWGETPQSEEYARRFPQFAARLGRIFEVHRALDSSRLRDAASVETPRPPRPAEGGRTRAAGWPAIAGYEILGELGRGGMGVVYKARHAQLNRLVALKMLRAGTYADAEDLSRFRAEAESQARLQHPHIVQIFEVGEADGRPYFALEYVDGGSLAQKGAGTPQAARPAAQLTETLARAVHHAHQHGLVHRDLKPANILLEGLGIRDQGSGSATSEPHSLIPNPQSLIPKITDFGLAKRLEGGDGQTQSGAIVGTPSYMAPEQAGGRSREVGPAADVYALGAILYELLTGRPPFLGETLLNTLLQVQSQDPVPVRRLQPKVARDLETICLKCLHKQPSRRYPTAVALAEDLERWLAGRPIRARPTGAAERLLKWAKRRPAVAALLLALVVLTAGSVAGLTGLWLRARAAEADARAVSQFLSEVLAMNRPGARGPKITLRQVLDDMAPEIDKQFAGRPAVEASVRQTFGSTYHALGLYPQAEPHLVRSEELYRQLRGPEHPDTLAAVNSLAWLRRAQGPVAEAEPLMRQNLETCRRVLGPEHDQTLRAMNNLAVLLRGDGKPDEAEPLAREQLEILRRLKGPEHPHTLAATNSLIGLLLDQRNLTEAEPLAWQNLETLRRVLGPEHPNTLRAGNHLARLLRAQDRHADAEQRMRENLEICRRVLGPEHPLTQDGLNSLASWLQSEDRLTEDRLREAEPLLRELLQVLRGTLLPHNRRLLNRLSDLCSVLVETGKIEEAEPLLRECLQLRRTHWPREKDALARVESTLGGCLTALGRYAEAEPLLLNSYETLATAQTMPVPQRKTLDRIVQLYEAWEKPEQASRWRDQRDKLPKPAVPPGGK